MLVKWVIVGAIVSGIPAAAAAQDAQQQPGHWLASGFVGSNFANNAQPASMDFGASLAYLWKDKYGAEIDTGFTPNFQLQNNFFGLGVKPQVNSYMANAVVAIPVGGERMILPFVSGGAGAMSLRSGLSPGASALLTGPDDTRFGGDVGAGVMGFTGAWGFKADVRYFRATGTYNAPAAAAMTNQNPGNPTPPGPYGLGAATAPAAGTATTSATPSIAGAALAGLHFWRANVGVAVRW